MTSHKIYTYADPFRIPETSFWDEIKNCPHLCSSRALVLGLSRLYGRDFVPCICTVENVLERIYPEWLTNTELHIKQRVLISNTIDQLDINWKMKRALKFNRHDLFKTVRFLQELNIDCSDLDPEELTSEQQYLVELYRELLTRHEDCFSMPGNFTMSEFSRALVNYMELEINEKAKTIEQLVESSLEGKEEKRYLESERRLLEWLEKQADQWRHFYSNNQEVKRVVLHGIHMFTPMRVKLIQELENCGVEVVFLHNYLPDYHSLYKTWDRVYSWVDTVAQRDEKIPVFRPDLHLQRPPLGEAMGDLLEGRFKPHDLSWLEYYEFDNMTSFANYAVEVYERAANEKGNSNLELTKSEALGEIFYSPNHQPINDIIRMYYPELYGERHFLAYPVGQFLMALYNMWDEELNELRIQPQLLKECFNSNLFVNQPDELKTVLLKTELFFKDVEAFRDYFKRLEKLIENVQLIKNSEDLKDLNMLAFYSCSLEELELFKDNILKLNKLAVELFGNSQDNRIHFKEHFEKLIKIIKEESRENRFLDEQEKQLLHGLMERFDNLNQLSITGSIEDLRDSIHYYLKQKETENQSNWLVNGFEQIEGDVLLSQLHKNKKYYHFSGITENNMHVNMDDRLPWPLTENFFMNGYNSENKSVDIVFNSMKEYKNFLRYALFFGLYYVQQPIRLSFIRNEDDEEQQPWFFFNLLGLEPEVFDDKELKADNAWEPRSTKDKAEKINVKPEKLDCQAYVFCPRRFLLDRVVDAGSPYYNEYHCSQFFTTIFYEKVWKKLSGKAFNFDSLAKAVNSVEKELKRFFPFWKPQVDFADKRAKVKKWMIESSEGSNFSEYNEKNKTYLDIKKHFIYARITENGENVLHELHRLRPNNSHTGPRKKAAQEINDLINYNKYLEYRKGPWCGVCKAREVCMESYKDKS